MVEGSVFRGLWGLRSGRYPSTRHNPSTRPSRASAYHVHQSVSSTLVASIAPLPIPFSLSAAEPGGND